MTSQIVRGVWASGRTNVVVTCEQSSGSAGIAPNPARRITGRLQLEEHVHILLRFLIPAGAVRFNLYTQARNAAKELFQ